MPAGVCATVVGAHQDEPVLTIVARPFGQRRQEYPDLPVRALDRLAVRVGQGSCLVTLHVDVPQIDERRVGIRRPEIRRRLEHGQ